LNSFFGAEVGLVKVSVSYASGVSAADLVVVSEAEEKFVQDELVF
jgi:hypothetical protein